ncbi:unnamed protein product [Aspergillus oryzae]|uniref:Unnamed protein product n=1 Tax=Aspergillus oryzae TaxID=5062 RepID=A0AAN4YIM4_ASPOZ|nr:unnamed protein product [Aspergillus oryzae]GMG30757.1 unnamed protein product [Aspergillus oryzae]
MQNPAQKVNVRSVDRLRGQEVMRHTGYSILQGRGHACSPVRDRLWKVLDDTADLGVPGGNLCANLAMRAADVNDCAFTGAEVVVIEEVR